MDPSREHELQQHGRLLPPTGRMHFPRAEGMRSGRQPGPPGHYKGALPPPSLPPGGPGNAAIPFDYGGYGGSVDGQEEGRQYAAVPFSYAAAEEAEQDAAAEDPQGQQQGLQQPAEEDVPFVPPFLVPEALQGRLPAGKRLYRVMRQTAAFVRDGGAQLEVLLRVRKAGDPAFAFLDPGDSLHPFYR